MVFDLYLLTHLWLLWDRSVRFVLSCRRYIAEFYHHLAGLGGFGRLVGGAAVIVVYLAGYIFCLQLAALPNISVAVLQLVRHMVKRGKTQPAKIAGAAHCKISGLLEYLGAGVKVMASDAGRLALG